MDRPAIEVADIFRRYGEAYRTHAGLALSSVQGRVMTAIERCRTAALGGHMEQCDQCGHTRVWFNSCRNRHCPRCQSLARAAWIHDRETDLLDCQYFHVVFTVPAEVAAIAYQNKSVVYGLLFHAAAETLRTIAADPQHLGAQIGFFAVLHTWGQTLVFHPHLHCVVPGGGLSIDGTRWVSCRPGFFLPVRVLSRLFRRLLLGALHDAFDAGQLRFSGSLQALSQPHMFAAHVQPTRQTEWVVYAKPPFAGPQQVLDYVGRYTHRIAISNHRLLDIDDGQVRFQYKDYRAASQKTLTLAATEFIRRFLLHVLPRGFHRIRYYGLLGNRHRIAKLAQCRELLGVTVPDTIAPASPASQDYRDRYEALTGISLRTCPVCGAGRMLVIEPMLQVPMGPSLTDTS
ncbi:MAG: IS91 family transposase [Acidobacteriota bacterium]